MQCADGLGTEGQNKELKEERKGQYSQEMNQTLIISKGITRD